MKEVFYPAILDLGRFKIRRLHLGRALCCTRAYQMESHGRGYKRGKQACTKKKRE
jgi:hypothetical protein